MARLPITLLLVATALVAAVANAAAPEAAADPAALVSRYADNLAYASPYSNLPDLALAPSDAALDHALRKRDAGAVTFDHGIASGDTLADAVILWTKVTSKDASVAVTYEVATTADFSAIIKSGAVLTSADIDYTVKVDVTGLSPATRYYYRFSANGVTSPVGTTKTLPAPGANLNSVKFAVVSCANMPHGLFHAYRNIAKRASEIDAVLMLGDAIYEYDLDGYQPVGGNMGPERDPIPAKVITTLADYRARHAQYKRDKDQQAMLALLPWLAIPDDHEFADNTWTNGSFKHSDAKDGPWAVRKLAAGRAYFEYMPIRPQAVGEMLKFWRKFQYGSFIDLAMLDTRSERTAPGGNGWTGKERPLRKMMGDDQEKWLHGTITNSTAHWVVLANQVIIAQMPEKIFEYEWSVTGDMWVGYPTTRDNLLRVLRDKKHPPILTLTGDFHSSIALDVYLDSEYDKSSGKGSLMVEFAGPSVTSSTPAQDSGFLNKLGAPVVKLFKKGAKYVDLYRHGYMLTTFTKEKVRNEYWYVRSIKSRDGDAELLGAAFESAHGSNRITSSYIA
ncbi:hypothetical protein H9P43_009990 [Blastocladiella emersonii ATCC 22665]|nr:hypothetical protein H9P43_009990 [Blastocladiella emersonii ATCC 22665]